MITDDKIAELSDPCRNGPVVVAMAEEIRDLRRDRARLDWCAYFGLGFVRGTDMAKWSVEANTDEERDVRAAIDAAMESQEGK